MSRKEFKGMGVEEEERLLEGDLTKRSHIPRTLLTIHSTQRPKGLRETREGNMAVPPTQEAAPYPGSLPPV